MKPVLNYARPVADQRSSPLRGGISRSLLAVNVLSLVVSGGWFGLWGVPHGVGSFLLFPVLIALIVAQFLVSLLPTIIAWGRGSAPWWEWVVLFGAALGAMGCSIYMLVG